MQEDLKIYLIEFQTLKMIKWVTCISVLRLIEMTQTCLKHRPFVESLYEIKKQLWVGMSWRLECMMEMFIFEFLYGNLQVGKRKSLAFIPATVLSVTNINWMDFKAICINTHNFWIKQSYCNIRQYIYNCSTFFTANISLVVKMRFDRNFSKSF